MRRFLIVLLALGLCGVHAAKVPLKAEKAFVFSGVYKVSEILPAYCQNCILSFPNEFLESSVILAVDTYDENELFKALKAASLANGWRVTRKGNTIKAVKVEDRGRLYLSCWDSLVHRVDSDEYALALQSDSMRCNARNQARESVLDSVKLERDKPRKFDSFELRYYNVSKTMTDKIGISWNEMLLSGDLRHKPQVFDDWGGYAAATSDTSFSVRKLLVSVDTTAKVSWGQELQVVENSYASDGVIYEDYEWRDYGMTLTLTRSDSIIKAEYTFRENDGTESQLTGESYGFSTDTLFLWGTYTQKKTETTGIPWLMEIPLFGRLFSVTENSLDTRLIALYLIPIAKEIKEVEE